MAKFDSPLLLYNRWGCNVESMKYYFVCCVGAFG